MQNSNWTWICPKCDFFNFADAFFDEQLNLDDENRFNPQMVMKLSFLQPQQ